MMMCSVALVSTVIVAGGKDKGRIAGKLPVVPSSKAARIALQHLENRAAQAAQVQLRQQSLASKK